MIVFSPESRINHRDRIFKSLSGRTSFISSHNQFQEFVFVCRCRIQALSFDPGQGVIVSATFGFLGFENNANGCP